MKKNRFLTDYRYLFACYRKLFRIMRLTAFFIVLAVCQALAISNYAQTKKIDLKIDQARIVDVLDKIEDQSDFFFFYNNKAVELDRKVSLDVKNKPSTKFFSPCLQTPTSNTPLLTDKSFFPVKKPGLAFHNSRKK